MYAMKNSLDVLLPHRRPFLFLDRLVAADANGCVGEYTFPADAEIFKGHFPDYAVVPGVLLIEAMAQCGGAGVIESGLADSKVILLASVASAKFRRPVRPDEKIRFEIKYLKTSQRLLRQCGKAYVGDEVAAEAEWVCVTSKQFG